MSGDTDSPSVLDSKPPAPAIRHDWYQTESSVTVTVLAKNVKTDDLEVKFAPNTLHVRINYPESQPYVLNLNLAHNVNPEECSYKVTTAKVEIKLIKQEGYRWDALEGSAEAKTVKNIPEAKAPVTAGPPKYPSSKPGAKDWSAVERDIKKQEEQEKPEGEEALNHLFQKIYGQGSDEVKKAMNKSYMESGGTVLSTNWDEIRKSKVDVKPPDGLEWKKWDS